MPTRTWLACLSLLLGTVLSSGAATHPVPPDPMLVSLDSPAVLGGGDWGGRVDVRIFGAKEDLVYTSLGVHYGFGSGWEAILRGTLAGRESLALPGGGAIRHGGNDVELLVKYQPPGLPNLAGLVGVAWPDTPAQNEPTVTVGVSAAYSFTSRLTAYLNPRCAFLTDNPVVGVGVGLRAEIIDQVALVGEFIPVVSGDNTRDTGTGARQTEHIYGGAVRLGPFGQASTFSFDLGFTNGTGSTTGFSLTPGLGGSGAFYAAVNGSF